MSAAKVNTATTSIKELWMDLPAIVKIVGGLAALTAIFFAVKAIIKGFGNARRTYVMNHSTFTGTTGSGNAITVDLGAKAQEIYDCFYDNDWFGGTEDEEGAITAISGVPKNLIKDLSDTYKIISDGKDLKSDFIKYLSASQYKQVSHLFI